MTKEELEKVIKQAKDYQETWPEWKRKFIENDFKQHSKIVSEFYKNHE